MEKNCFATLISTLGRFNRANKKKSVIYSLKICRPKQSDHQKWLQSQAVWYYPKNILTTVTLLCSPIVVVLYCKQDFIGTSDPKNVKQLIKKQAEWCETTNDPKAAV